nr:tight junction protein ZO-1-like [Vanessa tameamea]
MAAVADVCAGLVQHKAVLLRELCDTNVLDVLVKKGIFSVNELEVITSAVDSDKCNYFIEVVSKQSGVKLRDLCAILYNECPKLAKELMYDRQRYVINGYNGNTKENMVMNLNLNRESPRSRRSVSQCSCNSVSRRSSAAASPMPLPSLNNTMEMYVEPVVEDTAERNSGWETHRVRLNRVPGYGFGIAVSGGRDNPHFASGDPSIAVSDVLRGGPAEDKLQVNDRIVSVNGVPLENVEYARAVQVLRESGATVSLVVRRRAPAPPPTAPTTIKLALTRNGKKEDFGIVLGCKIYVKELTMRAREQLNQAGQGLCEGDVISRINNTAVTDAMTLKEAKKLVESCKDRLNLVITRELIREETVTNGNYQNNYSSLEATPHTTYPSSGDTMSSPYSSSGQNLYVAAPVRGADNRRGPLDEQPPRPPPPRNDDYYSSRRQLYEEDGMTNQRNKPPSEPRLISFQKEGSVGLRLCGGNRSGVFVSGVQPTSPAALQGLQPADKILKVNDMEMKGVTREEAVLFLLSLQERIDLIVQHSPDEYNAVASGQMPGDSFHIKTHFHYTEPTEGEMSFRCGDVFHVLDTLHNGTVGAWHVYRIGRNNQEVQKGTIPNKARAEELATAQFNATKKEMSGNDVKHNFFRRRRSTHRRSKSLGKEHWDEVVLSDSISKFPAYERVVLKQPGFVRPVIVLGAVADLARERLLADSPDNFSSPKMDSTLEDSKTKSTGIIRLSSIRSIMERGKHALLDITPNAVDRLNYAQFYPIVIFMKADSKHIIKQLRSGLPKSAHKSSKKLLEQCQHMERVWGHVFTHTITLSEANQNTWFNKLCDLIQRTQQQQLWVSETKHVEMVSDIYFPQPPSPYPAFYPISYPISYYPPSPQKPARINMSSSNSNTKLTNRHDVYDANRNRVVPYYYSETIPCMPNNMYSTPKPYPNRNRPMSNQYDERQQLYHRSKMNPRLQNSSISPELSQIFNKSNGVQSFRPYSVLETSKNSPLPNMQRPTSVVPVTEQFRPASMFFQDDSRKTNEVPEWKARLQKEMPKPILDKSSKKICLIPNCKCNNKPANNLIRHSESRTLPSVSERSLDKVKNLSLPTLKLDELDKFGKEEEIQVERDSLSLNKPVSEQHLAKWRTQRPEPLSDDFLFSMSSSSENRLSYASSPESDLEVSPPPAPRLVKSSSDPSIATTQDNMDRDDDINQMTDAVPPPYSQGGYDSKYGFANGNGPQSNGGNHSQNMPPTSEAPPYQCTPMTHSPPHSPLYGTVPELPPRSGPAGRPAGGVLLPAPPPSRAHGLRHNPAGRPSAQERLFGPPKENSEDTATYSARPAHGQGSLDRHRHPNNPNYDGTPPYDYSGPASNSNSMGSCRLPPNAPDDLKVAPSIKLDPPPPNPAHSPQRTHEHNSLDYTRPPPDNYRVQDNYRSPQTRPPPMNGNSPHAQNSHSAQNGDIHVRNTQIKNKMLQRSNSSSCEKPVLKPILKRQSSFCDDRNGSIYTVRDYETKTIVKNLRRQNSMCEIETEPKVTPLLRRQNSLIEYNRRGVYGQSSSFNMITKIDPIYQRQQQIKHEPFYPTQPLPPEPIYQSKEHIVYDPIPKPRRTYASLYDTSSENPYASRSEISNQSFENPYGNRETLSMPLLDSPYATRAECVREDPYANKSEIVESSYMMTQDIPRKPEPLYAESQYTSKEQMLRNRMTSESPYATKEDMLRQRFSESPYNTKEDMLKQRLDGSLTKEPTYGKRTYEPPPSTSWSENSYAIRPDRRLQTPVNYPGRMSPMSKCMSEPPYASRTEMMTRINQTESPYATRSEVKSSCSDNHYNTTSDSLDYTQNIRPASAECTYVSRQEILSQKAALLANKESTYGSKLEEKLEIIKQRNQAKKEKIYQTRLEANESDSLKSREPLYVSKRELKDSVIYESHQEAKEVPLPLSQEGSARSSPYELSDANHLSRREPLYQTPAEALTGESDTFQEIDFSKLRLTESQTDSEKEKSKSLESKILKGEPLYSPRLHGKADHISNALKVTTSPVPYESSTSMETHYASECSMNFENKPQSTPYTSQDLNDRSLKTNRTVTFCERIIEKSPESSQDNSENASTSRNETTVINNDTTVLKADVSEDNESGNKTNEVEPDGPHTTWGVFDSDGGILEDRHWGVSLIIPPKAIAPGIKQKIYFTVSDPRLSQRVGGPPIDMDNGEAMLSPLVMCGPQGLVFLKPVTLRLPHCANAVPSLGLTIKATDTEAHLSTDWDQIHLPATTTLNTVAVKVDHF